MIFMILVTGRGASFAVVNIAVDGGGSYRLQPSIPIDVTAVAGGAVTSARSEINPAVVTAGSLANNFTVDLTSTINPSATGLNQFTLTAPVGYNMLGVSGLTVDGTPMTSDCALDTADDYCPTVGALLVTVAFRDKITANGANIRFNLTTDVPPVPGSASFSATVDDTTSIAFPPQAVNPANADGDGSNNNSLTVNVALVAPDPGLSTVTASPTIVIADGAATSVISTTIVDTSGNPLSGREVTLFSSRAATDSFTPSPVQTTGPAGTTTHSVSSFTPGVATISARDTTGASILLPMTATVYFTQGQVLEVIKIANRKEVGIGELVSYNVTIRNLDTINPVSSVKLNDIIPPNFKYLKNSGRMNGTTPLEPTGSRPIVFDIGTILAGGSVSLSYQLIVGSGATPGDYTNTAFATDVCDQCLISNRSQAEVQVTLDPLFDLGTIIGKVFRDNNRDGWQDDGEEGVAGAMVALDNGTYVITDENGRYHFPALQPGHRLVKINLNNLGIGAKCSRGETRIVSVTPGLLAKVNFGVSYNTDLEQIGRPGERGLILQSNESQEPFQIIGNFTGNSLLINGRSIELPFTDITMSFAELSDIVTITSGKLEKPIKFITSSNSLHQPANWTFRVFDEYGEMIKTFTGNGPPPSEIIWDGIIEKGELITGGAVYQFQMESNFENGTIIHSPRKMFGVNNTSMVALDLAGSAFHSGSDQLSEQAKEVLRQTATILRDYPKEKIMIEGHTDSVGDVESNMDLSRRRAQAASSFLIETEDIDPDRFIVNWYGESKPLASNLLEEGRELNRRVAIKGEITEIDRAALHNQYRTAPEVSLNGLEAEIDSQGRFTAELPISDNSALTVDLKGPMGDHSRTTLAIPSIEIYSPGTEGHVIPFRSSDGSEQVYHYYEIKGRTEPGNILSIDSQVVDVGSDGSFRRSVPLTEGPNHYGITAQNKDGLTAITNLTITLDKKDIDGKAVMLVSPIPDLEVEFPAGDSLIKAEKINISGRTDPANRLQINGQDVVLDLAGSFNSKVILEAGESQIIVTATDPEGYQGTISKNILVSENELFYLAFADGKVGQLQSEGYLDGTGVDNSKDFYTEGRLAFYMKGRIRGKYLLTAAFDSGTNEIENLFDNLDSKENDRLLTNIDPDKLYPVYGDASTLVYDTDSQGKLYLALDSDAFGLLIIRAADRQLQGKI
jgi:uncharacterized repeat protein (TIGR01451 family)